MTSSESGTRGDIQHFLRVATGRGRALCSYGTFRRVIALPDGIKADEAKATFKNGVLVVTLPAPKGQDKHGRRLDIQAS